MSDLTCASFIRIVREAGDRVIYSGLTLSLSSNVYLRDPTCNLMIISSMIVMNIWQHAL